MYNQLPNGEGIITYMKGSLIEVSNGKGKWNFDGSELILLAPTVESKEFVMSNRKDRKKRIEFLYDDGSRYTCRNVRDLTVGEEIIIVEYTRNIDDFIKQEIKQVVPKKNVVAIKTYESSGDVSVKIFKERTQVYVYRDL